MSNKIVISLISDEQEYQRFLAADAREAARTAGLLPEVIYAEGNPVSQIRQLFQYVHLPAEQRPAAIVLQTVSGRGGEKLALSAVRAGIPWILINRDADYFAELRRVAPAVPSFAVNIEHAEIGRLQGRLLRTLLPQGGPVLYLKGPPEAASSVERHRGFEEALQGVNSSLSVIYGDWSAASATAAVADWLRLKPLEVRAVVAQNDAMAMAARKALGTANYPVASMPVIGCDGTPSIGQRAVQEGELSATVVVPPPTAPAIALLMKHRRTGEMPPLLTRLPLAIFPATGQGNA